LNQEPQEIQTVKVVVLSPHRDDAAFSLSLALEAWIAQGHTVEVINCFTRSAYGPFSDAESLHPNDRASYVTAVRLREDVAWSRKLGPRLTLTDLNLKDAPIRLRCSPEELSTLPVNPTDKAIEKIRKTLERTRTDALVLPLAIGNHIDHRTAQHAALIAPVPCYAFYEDLPYAAQPGAAETIESTAHALNPELQPAFATAPGDVTAATLRKRKLALYYDSQIDDAATDEIARFCVRYEGRERLWANEAWRTSELAVNT
jgi:LmbE family N-acetylglucosaminyl deacetylase